LLHLLGRADPILNRRLLLARHIMASFKRPDQIMMQKAVCMNPFLHSIQFESIVDEVTSPNATEVTSPNATWLLLHGPTLPMFHVRVWLGWLLYAWPARRPTPLEIAVRGLCVLPAWVRAALAHPDEDAHVA
jgi:hypothetical protein